MNSHFMIYKGWRTKWHGFQILTLLFSVFYSFMLSSIVYLNQTGIFFTNICLNNLPQAWICSFYHADFGPSFLSTRDVYSQILIQDQFIEIWFHHHAYVWEVAALINQSNNTTCDFFLQQPLEAWDYWKSCWLFGGQNIRCFAFPIIVLSLTYSSSMFYLLDSLLTSNSAQSKVKQLQRIFLNYFDQESLKKVHIAANVAQVGTLIHFMIHPSLASVK